MFQLDRQSEERWVPGATVHYMCYTIRTDSETHCLDVPCRSRLHHLITGLFYNFDWHDEEKKEITEDDFFILKHIFTSQREYNLWKKAMKVLKDEGMERAKQVLTEKIQLLTLRKVMSGQI